MNKEEIKLVIEVLKEMDMLKNPDEPDESRIVILHSTDLIN